MNRYAVLVGALILAACGDSETTTLQGYGEAQYLYAASQDGGPLIELLVKEGDRVSAGQALFRTDKVRLELAAQRADADAAAAAARVSPGGTLAEAVSQAEAAAELARQTYDRTVSLVRAGHAPQAQLDVDRGKLDAANAALAQARANLTEAQNTVVSTRASAALAHQQVDDAEVTAPAASSVQRIYHRAGEVIAPGMAVLSLLPDENMKVRFFVPEPQLSSFAVGKQIRLACDGCPAGLTARVSFVAAEPQFTPPVIYSLEEREKLVFLAEAIPDRVDVIRPGLPVDITP